MAGKLGRCPGRPLLTLDWIDELTEVVAADDRLRGLAAEHRIGVTQVVAEGPEGDVMYHLQVGDGAARFGTGPPSRRTSGWSSRGTPPWRWPPVR